MSRFDFGGDGPEPLDAGRMIAHYKRILIEYPEATLRTLIELKAALESLPEKRLIAGRLCSKGKVCALGAYAEYKGMSKRKLARVVRLQGWDDYQSPSAVSEWFAKNLPISQTLAYLIQEENDSDESLFSDKERYRYMLRWVNRTIESPETTFADLRERLTAWFTP